MASEGELAGDTAGGDGNATIRNAEPVSLAAMLARVIARLRAAGIDEAASEARELLMVAAKLDAIEILMRGERMLDAAAVAQIEEFTRRRAAREPISRIAGEREFYGRGFSLSEGTLDPRADTETLVSATLAIVREQGRQNEPLRLLDIGTGSGAIVVTLLAELPAAIGLGIDISADALTTAARNAARHGVAGRLALVERDASFGIDGTFDLIVANPPYIPSGDIAGLEPEVRCHDPRAALDGGADGLDFYRWLAGLQRNLAPSGWLLVEVGAGQAAEVTRILTGYAGDIEIRTFQDLGGHARVVAVQPHTCERRE